MNNHHQQLSISNATFQKVYIVLCLYHHSLIQSLGNNYKLKLKNSIQYQDSLKIFFTISKMYLEIKHKIMTNYIHWQPLSVHTSCMLNNHAHNFITRQNYSLTKYKHQNNILPLDTRKCNDNMNIVCKICITYNSMELVAYNK